MGKVEDGVKRLGRGRRLEIGRRFEWGGGVGVREVGEGV